MKVSTWMKVMLYLDRIALALENIEHQLKTQNEKADKHSPQGVRH